MRATTHPRRLAIFVLEDSPQRLSGSWSIYHPRFIVERCLNLKRPWQKLTVFRAAANRSAAFQSGCLGCVGLDSAQRRAIPDWERW
jgi:hypothetical protein